MNTNPAAPGGPDNTPEARQNWLSRVPQRRYGESDEIARAAAFLLDDEQSAYVTGHVLAVDGGFLAGGLLPQ